MNKTKLTETEKQTLASAESTMARLMGNMAEQMAFDVADHTAAYLRAKRTGNAKRMEREAWILSTRGIVVG